jgi:ABC-type lipoprotein release transport system permease subunit
MARKGISNNQILLILTIPITIGSVVTILSFLATTGVIGGLESDIRSLSDQVDQQPALDDLLAQFPIPDPTPTNVTIIEQTIVEQPEGFTSTDQDLITAFLDAIGVTH